MILRSDATRLPLPDESISSVVCDPPYGLGFMNKSWDSVGYGFHLDWACECLRVLRPGGHLIAFGGTRTVHRLACAIEDAGFEIRDTIAWLQWQGFPKSLDVSKAIDAAAGVEREVVGKGKYANRGRSGRHAVWMDPSRGLGVSSGINVTAPATPLAQEWQGWGTALKPALEPAVLARKPLEGTVAANVAKHGCGALNIDACRYEQGDSAWPGPQDEERPSDMICKYLRRGEPCQGHDCLRSQNGRTFHKSRNGELSANRRYTEAGSSDFAPTPGPRGGSELGRYPANIYATPKAGRAEREAGCAGLPAIAGHDAVDRKPDTAGLDNPRAGAGRTAGVVHNSHPT